MIVSEMTESYKKKQWPSDDFIVNPWQSSGLVNVNEINFFWTTYETF